jgi:hypothetical protein
MFICNQSKLRSLAAVLHMFMSIWLDPFPAQPVSPISSPSWTGRPAGQKRYRLPPCPPPTAQPGSFMDGSSGSAYPQPSPATGARNSLLPCGLHCAPSSTSAICRLLPIIHRQTTPWNDFTAVLRTRYGPAQPGQTGTPTCHGFCSASGPHGGKIRSSLQPRQFLERSQFSQASFSTHQSRRRRHSSKSCSRHSATELHNRNGPLNLPEELMLTRYVLVRRDGAQPPLSPMYDGPYLVLERSLRFFNYRTLIRSHR